MHLCTIVKYKSKYSKIPCSVEKNPKTTSKICSLSKQDLWFSTNKYLQLLLIFPKTFCLKALLFSKTPSFEQSQVTSP